VVSVEGLGRARCWVSEGAAVWSFVFGVPVPVYSTSGGGGGWPVVV
jgi:hypothetical protein